MTETLCRRCILVPVDILSEGLAARPASRGDPSTFHFGGQVETWTIIGNSLTISTSEDLYWV